MVAILGAESFNVLYKQPQFYSVSKSSTGTPNTGGAWLDTWQIHIISYHHIINFIVLAGVQMSVSS